MPVVIEKQFTNTLGPQDFHRWHAYICEINYQKCPESSISLVTTEKIPEMVRFYCNSHYTDRYYVSKTDTLAYKNILNKGMSETYQNKPIK